MPDLEEMKTYFDSTGLIFKAPGKFPITTTEGLAALEEAIAYIETVPAPTRLRRLQDEWRTNLIASDNQTIAEGMV